MEEKQDGLTGLTRKRAESLMNEAATNASPNESSSPKAPLKQDNSYKPGILLSSNNLEEFNAWQSTFEAHHDKNATWLLRL